MFVISYLYNGEFHAVREWFLLLPRWQLAIGNDHTPPIKLLNSRIRKLFLPMTFDVSTNNVLQYLHPFLILYKVRGKYIVRKWNKNLIKPKKPPSFFFLSISPEAPYLAILRKTTYMLMLRVIAKTDGKCT